MHSLLVSLLASSVAVAPVVSAVALTGFTGPTKPNYWFSFGDSYTTTGFLPNETLPAVGNPLGNPAYPGYTGGGGSNWVDVDTTVYNKSLILTYNYAYGGATIDASLVTPYLPTVLSLKDQVNEFLDTAAKKPASAPWTSEDSLFSIWIGINDIGNSYGWTNVSSSAFADLLLNTEFALVEKLYGAGARNFLWVNVPPIDRSPLMLANPVSDQALEKTVIAGFNKKLAAKIAAFESEHPGIKTYLWDSNTAFTTILNDLPKYGFINNATAYGDTGDFWGNTYHPSSAAHDIFGKEIATFLESTIWW